jgi:type II secretory pathway pseudopilin PulG
MKKCNLGREGQTLVEMIVIIGTVVLLTSGIVAGTTISLGRSQLSQTRSRALALAQEGIELARGKRDNGWDAFVLMANPTSTYCVGSDSSFGVAGAACTTPNIQSTFTRSIKLQSTTIAGIPTIKVTSQAAWGDISSPSNTVQLTTYLTQWK